MLLSPVVDEQPTAMPFDLQPIWKGELVEVRPLKPDDFEDLYPVVGLVSPNLVQACSLS